MKGKERKMKWVVVEAARGAYPELSKAALRALPEPKRQQRRAIRLQLLVAEDKRLEPAIYFPWRPDSRGRLYPDSDALNPDTGDLSRGLLRFARAEPLGARGKFWLAVHIANCQGKEK